MLNAFAKLFRWGADRLRHRSTTQPHLLYYKREDPYLCSAMAPVLEGAGSRHLYRRKGTTSTVFMFVWCTFRSSDFLLFVKSGFVVGARKLNVTAGD